MPCKKPRNGWKPATHFCFIRSGTASSVTPWLHKADISKPAPMLQPHCAAHAKATRSAPPPHCERLHARRHKATVERLGRCVVAVSEGIHDGSGHPMAAQLASRVEHDAHGNVQLSGSGSLADALCEEIKHKLGLTRVRGDTLGYLQRSFVGCVSDVDQREAREVGEKAVQYAMWGDRNGSVAIRRSGYYAVDYELLPLEAVAGRTRVMEAHFIADCGTDVTDAFRLYLRPLLGSGMPDAFRLRPNPVPPVLAPRARG